MATEATHKRKTPAPTPDAPSAIWADPVPEQRPWHSPEDAEGWRRVFRGDGRPRALKNVLTLELSDDQWTWLDDVAEAADVTPHAIVAKLIDEARARPTE